MDINTFIYFTILFVQHLISIMYWVLLIWVVLSWLVMFRVMAPDNPGFHVFSQMALPILKPFRWARIGMLDLSPIVAILALDFAGRYLIQGLQSLI